MLCIGLLVTSACTLAGGAPSAEPTHPEPAATAAHPIEKPTITPPGPAESGFHPVEVAAAPALLARPIYDQTLTPGWSVETSNGAQVGEQTTVTHGGKRAVHISPGQDYGTVTFTVRADVPTRFPRRDYVGARFWINPGDRDLAPDNLVLAIQGSDSLPYWSSVEADRNRLVVASGSLLQLGYERPLRSNTWTQIEVWFGRLDPPPTFNYITALSLTTGKGERQPIYLSELHLLGISDARAPTLARAASSGLTGVLVKFSEPVDQAAATRAANYALTSSDDPAFANPVSPTSVTYDPATFTSRLTLATRMKAGSTYRLQASRMADLSQPPNVAQQSTAAFTVRVASIKVDTTRNPHPISPLIYGVTNATMDFVRTARPGLNSWGGAPASRYNWELGAAWNLGREGMYRNTDLGYRGKSASDDFVAESLASGAAVRITLPTLGWVARNSNPNTCSFPLPDGTCGDANRVDCQRSLMVADPAITSTASNVDSVVSWAQHLLRGGGKQIRIFAFDHEPDLWGTTHFDVHPKCTSYDEILGRYLEYAPAVRAVAPNVELAGPVVSDWYHYWNSSAGIADKVKHDNLPFLDWFLREVRAHDERTGKRTLDILDIHYSPAAVAPNAVDARASELRLRSTRSLWDPTYIDESAIREPVNLIPRMQALIAEQYPGTKLGISAWSWGAETSMAGALAIADVLGIFGREGVYMAAHAAYPPLASPSYRAFRLYTNYDGRGGHFGDTSVYASAGDADDLAVYAATDTQSKSIFVVVINKHPNDDVYASIDIVGRAYRRSAVQYRLGKSRPDQLVAQQAVLTPDTPLAFEAYSATLLVIDAAD